MATPSLNDDRTCSGAPPCAYPQCRESTRGGIVVRGLAPGPFRKTYCCEWHLVLDHLRALQADFGDVDGDMILPIVEKQLRGELVLVPSDDALLATRDGELVLLEPRQSTPVPKLSIVWRNPHSRREHNP